MAAHSTGAAIQAAVATVPAAAVATAARRPKREAGAAAAAVRRGARRRAARKIISFQLIEEDGCVRKAVAHLDGGGSKSLPLNGSEVKRKNQ